VSLRLVDDGQGLAPDWTQRTGHYGLRWLTERVESLGGTFGLSAAEPRGAVLEVRVPLPAILGAAESALAPSPATTATAPTREAA
jgi:two-component system sensor histidine kinase UhpB